MLFLLAGCGSTPTKLTPSLSGAGYAYFIAFGGYLYWQGIGGYLFQMPVSGGTPALIANDDALRGQIDNMVGRGSKSEPSPSRSGLSLRRASGFTLAGERSDKALCRTKGMHWSWSLSLQTPFFQVFAAPGKSTGEVGLDASVPLSAGDHSPAIAISGHWRTGHTLAIAGAWVCRRV
jgi:hypothetical protein